MRGAGSEPFEQLKIIDEDLFVRYPQAVKDRLTKNFDGKPMIFRTDIGSLLTGIIFCGHCGCRFCHNHQHEERKLAKSDKAVYDYEIYCCYRKISSTRTCNGQSGYKASVLNDAVEKQVKLFFSKIQSLLRKRLVELVSDRSEETYKVAFF